MTSCVFSCLQLWAGKLSASYFVGRAQPSVLENEVQMHFVHLWTQLGDKGWNLSWQFFGCPKFWGVVLKWRPCAMTSMWCCFAYSFKNFLRLLETWGLYELHCFQVTCLKAVSITYRNDPQELNMEDESSEK